jgi:AcrR family transcriptional regulator
VPRRVLSQDAIITAALHLVDAEGIDALSMRRVAQELGTGAASLYAHVSGRDELIGLVLDRVRADIRCPEPDPDQWEQQVKDVMRQARGVLAAHGDLARLSLEMGVPTGENAMRTAEGILAILKAAGLPVQVCAYAVDALSLYVTATAAEEAARSFGSGAGPVQGQRDFLEQVRAYYGSLPPDRFPVLTGMVDELMRDVGDERFEFGLDLMIAGLARHAPKR